MRNLRSRRSLKSEKQQFDEYKKEHAEIARQLLYDDEVVDKIENATTEFAVQVSMTTGRKRMRDK